MYMDKKISPIKYEDFHIKYIFKNEAPVKGSDEMIFIDSYLNRLIWSLAVSGAFFPYVMCANYLSYFVIVYTIIITLVAYSGR